MVSRLFTPVFALFLGLVPFALFIGSVDRVAVNGALVAEQRFNVFGLFAALLGLWLAFTVLRPSAPRDALRKGIAALALLACALQLATALDLVRPLG